MIARKFVFTGRVLTPSKNNTPQSILCLMMIFNSLTVVSAVNEAKDPSLISWIVRTIHTLLLTFVKTPTQH